MYSKIEIFGNQDGNYMWSKKGTMTNDEINALIKSDMDNPSWDLNSILLAKYQDSLIANESSLDGNIIGYKIQREDSNSETRINIGTFDSNETIIQDYSVGNRIESKYYIIPIVDDDGMQIYGDPVISDIVSTNYDGWSIVGLLPGNVKNEYIVDKNNIWYLDLNIEPEAYVLNTDKTFNDGFGRFSKSVSGSRMYLTSGLSALIGRVDCNGDYVDDNANRNKRFYKFCHSPNLKLLKDRKGNVLLVDIEPQPQITIDEHTIQQQSAVSIKFREMEDINNVVVKGLVI